MLVTFVMFQMKTESNERTPLLVSVGDTRGHRSGYGGAGHETGQQRLRPIIVSVQVETETIEEQVCKFKNENPENIIKLNSIKFQNENPENIL